MDHSLPAAISSRLFLLWGGVDVHSPMLLDAIKFGSSADLFLRQLCRRFPGRIVENNTKVWNSSKMSSVNEGPILFQHFLQGRLGPPQAIPTRDSPPAGSRNPLHCAISMRAHRARLATPKGSQADRNLVPLTAVLLHPLYDQGPLQNINDYLTCYIANCWLVPLLLF